ncbi:MFS transporter [Desulfovibrio sp. OttesenSCG-928-G15]|nr:MFS transporter [Desulfovibrio sp. OttesenSCG-928-G15]
MRHPVLNLVLGLSLTTSVGISGLIPILPRVAAHFGLPPADSWMIIAAYALAGLCCVPLSGILSDRMGRKALLIPALLLFIMGGTGCAMAASFNQLLAWRVVQGMGSASLSILATSIIADTWQGMERIRAMSLNAFVLGVSTAACPALGGALGMLDWRLSFLLPLPALVLVWMAWRLPLLLPVKGASLKAYAAACLDCMLKRRTLWLLCLTLLTFIMMSGPIITCFPLLAESIFAASPLECGLLIASASLSAGLSAPMLPRLCKTLSCAAILVMATAAYIAAFVCIGLAPGFAWLVPGLLLYGLGQGLNLPLVQTLLVGQAKDSERGALMALNAMLLRAGQNIGPWGFGSLAAALGPGTAILFGCVPALAILLVSRAIPLPLAGELSATAAEAASPGE